MGRFPDSSYEYAFTCKNLLGSPGQFRAKKCDLFEIGGFQRIAACKNWQIRFSSPLVKLFSKQPSFPLELKGKEIPGQRPREQSLRLLSLILLHFHPP